MVDLLFLLVVFSPPVVASFAGIRLAAARRRARAKRLLGAGLCLVGLAELGLLLEWMNNLCWDEGGSCGQPLDTMFDVMFVTWFVLAAMGLAAIAAWLAGAIWHWRSSSRHRH